MCNYMYVLSRVRIGKKNVFREQSIQKKKGKAKNRGKNCLFAFRFFLDDP